MFAWFKLLYMAWEAWRFRRGDGAAISRRQQTRLQSLVNYARTASPYYRHLYRGVPSGPTDLQSLPPTNKRDLMANFDDWVTDPAVTLEALRRDFLSDPSLAGARYLGRYHVATTSGTSGEPAIIVHDADSWALLHMIGRRGRARYVSRLRLLAGIARRGLRAAALFAGGGHFGAAVALESARRRTAYFARSFRLFSVLRPLPEIVAALNDFQPTVLEGYPSALVQLAGEQRAARLRIEPLLALTAGEDLTRAARTAIESTFGCPVENRYGSSEFVALAVECVQGFFHVNSDWFIVEPVDEEYRPVEPGVISHTILVTNLANRVQPLIRYDLGDRVKVAAAPCPCGNRLPAITVEGRTGELLEFEGPHGRLMTVVPLALGTVVEETPGVRRFQVIRTDPRTINVRLQVCPDAEPTAVWHAVHDRLQTFLASQGLASVDVRRSPRAPAVNPRSGKFRQVFSSCSD